MFPVCIISLSFLFCFFRSNGWVREKTVPCWCFVFELGVWCNSCNPRWDPDFKVVFSLPGVWENPGMRQKTYRSPVPFCSPGWGICTSTIQAQLCGSQFTASPAGSEAAGAYAPWINKNLNKCVCPWRRMCVQSCMIYAVCAASQTVGLVGTNEDLSVRIPTVGLHCALFCPDPTSPPRLFWQKRRKQGGPYRELEPWRCCS